MIKLLYVGLGGFLGSVARYLLAGYVQKGHGLNFPWGTLVVNAIGCFLIGLLGHILQAKHSNSEIWLFLIVGILGGFTTFSAFGYETFNLFKNAQLTLALLNIGLQIVVCLGAVWLGYVVSRGI